jgi:hypothetical protein
VEKFAINDAGSRGYSQLVICMHNVHLYNWFVHDTFRYKTVGLNNLTFALHSLIAFGHVFNIYRGDLTDKMHLKRDGKKLAWPSSVALV